jgi:hypothetical protein
VIASLCVLLGALAAGGATARTESSVLWLDLGGKGQDTHLSIAETWPLSHFARHMPYWSPEQSETVRLPDGQVGVRSSGLASPTTLLWQPLEAPATITPLGAVGGLSAYQIVYSTAYHVVVWDRGGSSFTPAAIVAGGEELALGIDVGRVFRWNGQDVLHVRIQFEGTGHFQQSLFFVALGGRLVDVREDERNRERVATFFSRHGIRHHHRGLGFCEDTLTEVLPFVGDDCDGPAGLCEDRRVLVEYRIEGAVLTVDRIAFGPASPGCEMFPKRH